jgi:ribosomal protein L32
VRKVFSQVRSVSGAAKLQLCKSMGATKMTHHLCPATKQLDAIEFESAKTKSPAEPGFDEYRFKSVHFASLAI